MKKVFTLFLKSNFSCVFASVLKKNISLALIVTFLNFINCIHSPRIPSSTILHTITKIAEDMQSQKITPTALRNIKIGQSGYCYLLDPEGTVISHPHPSIEGINFSGIPLIKLILQQKSGCFIQFIEGQEKIIIFRSAEPYGILCASISAHEVELEKKSCERFE
ncbi:MAG: hypothetical protein N2316_08045 [Spirochaetes bacterium]|nr:hypothetical protein [Spirochaetota bacterium]